MKMKLQGFNAGARQQSRSGLQPASDPADDAGALAREGKHEAAVKAYLQALKSDNTDIQNLLGMALSLKAMQRWDEALQALDLLLAVEPEHVEALFQRGHVCELAGRLDDAVGHYLRTIRVDERNAHAFNNLGAVLYGLGQVKESTSAFQMALQLKPSLDNAQSSFLATMNYRSDLDPRDIIQAHHEWGSMIKQRIRALAPGRMRPAEPPFLRLGILTGDLFEHPISNFLEPLLQHLDRSRFKLYIYSWTHLQDAYTLRFRQLADVWVESRDLSHEALARRMREDQINIALELAGHTSSNRLPVLAYRPAPVQVSWLGYPNTTGLSAMDFRILDEVVAPEGGLAELGSEAIIRLPHGFHCYQPPEETPEIGDLPFDRSGVITFGCFNRNPKLSPETLSSWIDILKAVPESRLLLKSKWFLDSTVQDLTIKPFVEAGISEDRIVFLPWKNTTSEGLAIYNEVDITLDPYPYNGTTTTCEAVWMGVPVVSRCGESQVCRTGRSLMRQMGLEEWVASDRADYVEKAVKLAENPQLLRDYRGTLRDRMRRSPLMDGPAFGREMGDALFKAWREKIGVHLADNDLEVMERGKPKEPEPQAPVAPTVSKNVKKTGVLYVIWGEQGEAYLERSRKSLKVIHPELPVEVMRLPDGSNLLDKARAIRQSPFDRTLFLDVDTVVLDRLDFGFEMADRNGLACCICECPWARRYPSIGGDHVEYNTGVLFFTRKAKAALKTWDTLSTTLDSSIQMLVDGQIRVMQLNDQASFAQAICEWDRTPFILPMNWNFRPLWHRSVFGPVKIWHDYRDVPALIRKWCFNQRKPDSIIQYLELPAACPS